MIEYPSIKNLYASNEINGAERRRGPEFGFSHPSFGHIGQWLVLEKVDGTNVRVIFEPAAEKVLRYAGRTDNAQLHPQLMAHLDGLIADEGRWFETFFDEEGIGPERIILFGEGYGPGIQKAGVAYGGDKRFILFDVLVGDRWWLGWDDVVDVARKLGIPTVPAFALDADLKRAKSLVAETALLDDASHAEGVILRTDPYLFDGRGHRIMAKYKVRDLT